MIVIDEDVLATMRIKPKVAIPMHIFEANPQKFKKQVEGISDSKVETLEIGKVYLPHFYL